VSDATLNYYDGTTSDPHDPFFPFAAKACLTSSTVSVRSFPSFCNTSPSKGMSLQRLKNSVCQGHKRHDHLVELKWENCFNLTHFTLNLRRTGRQLLLWATLGTWWTESLKKKGQNTFKWLIQLMSHTFGKRGETEELIILRNLTFKNILGHSSWLKKT